MHIIKIIVEIIYLIIVYIMGTNSYINLKDLIEKEKNKTKKKISLNQIFHSISMCPKGKKKCDSKKPLKDKKRYNK